MESGLSILIVEDEKTILELLHAALEEDGYKVILAGTGEEAVALLDKHKDIRGVATDVRLGGKDKLSGWDVARHARKLNPDIAVVYMSGDSGADWPVEGVPKSIMVGKPFVMSQIAMALATLLNKAG